MMRCPKCGYISFDNQDNCKKCRKPVKPDELLEGLIFAVKSPIFLGFNGGEDDNTDSHDTGLYKIKETEPLVDISMDDNNDQDTEQIEIDFGEEDNQQFSLELDPSEGAPNSEPKSLDFDETPEEEQIENGIKLDFTDIDISDLTPSQGKSIADPDDKVDIEFAELELSPAVEQKSGSGLDDLLIDDLELKAPAPSVAESKKDHMPMPFLKTGTALDDFEVDLGDFIVEEK